MIPNKYILPIVLLLAILIPMNLASQEKITPQQLDKIKSVPELKDLLDKRALVVEALTKKSNWLFEEISGEMDLIDAIANRLHYLSKHRGDEIKPLTKPLLQKVVTILDMIFQATVKEMEVLQLGAMEDEEAMESLYASRRWKELEVTVSIANYRLNKAKYYWALVCPDNSPEKIKLLKEASDGFLYSYNVVYQNAQLTAYSFLGRALCIRELGNFQESIKELDYIIQKGEESLSPTILWRARYERARTYLLAGKEYDCLQEVNILLNNTIDSDTDPNLVNNMKFLKIKASFIMITRKENKLNPQQVKDIYSEALITAKQLIKVSDYWQNQVFSVLTQDIVREYLMQQDLHDPYIGWILGEGLFYEKRFAEAISFFKTALSTTASERHPDKGDINFKLGICYYNLKRFKEAIPYFAKSIFRYPKADTLEKAAYLHYRSYENLYGENWSKSYIKAIDHYLKHFPQHPFASDAHYRLGKYYGQKEKRLAAIRELEKVKKGSRYFIQARFFIYKYRTEEFERLRAKPGTDIKQLYRDAMIARNKFMAAIGRKSRDKWQRRGLNEIMGYAALLSAKLFIYGPEGKYQQAIDVLKNFERTFPNQKELFPLVKILRIEAFQRLQDFKKAKEEVKRFIKSYNTSPKAQEILSLLAEQFSEKGDRVEKPPISSDAALEKNKIAILIYENLFSTTQEEDIKEDIQYSLAPLYLKLGDYQRAKSIYQEIIMKNPQSIQALNGLGEIYEREEKYQQALEYWRILEEKLTVGDPAWYDAKYRLAATYDKIGNKQQACKILTVTRLLHPDLGGKDSKHKFLRLEEKVCSSKR
jgi:tetratricopeptide (TPR) repeat protein